MIQASGSFETLIRAQQNAMENQRHQHLVDFVSRQEYTGIYGERLIGLSNLSPVITAEPLNTNYTPEAAPASPSAEYRPKLAAVGAVALLSKVSADEECAKFMDEVRTRGLRFYDKENVERYLTGEARKKLGGNFRVEWVHIAQYGQAIPSPVVDTMVWIKADFPVAEFYIFEVKRFPDPFLMVRVHGREYVIEKWDEPGYREE